jgi:hypothetical protein
MEMNPFFGDFRSMAVSLMSCVGNTWTDIEKVSNITQVRRHAKVRLLPK